MVFDAGQRYSVTAIFLKLSFIWLLKLEKSFRLTFPGSNLRNLVSFSRNNCLSDSRAIEEKNSCIVMFKNGSAAQRYGSGFGFMRVKVRIPAKHLLFCC